MGLIVDEEQGAADNLVGLEEFRDRKGGPYGSQTLYVAGLYAKKKKKRKENKIKRKEKVMTSAGNPQVNGIQLGMLG